MHFRIDSSIFERFPGTSVGCIVAYAPAGFMLPSGEASNSYHQIQEFLLTHLSKDSYKNHPFFKAWQDVYTASGLSPKKYVPSAENLVARLIKQGSLKSVVPLVDMYNTISLKYLLPMGADDLDTVHGSVELRYATSEDAPVKTLGAQGEERAVVGETNEIVYADDQGILCRMWNWRQAERTKVTEQTTRLIIFIDGVDGIERRYVESATSELAHMIRHYFSAQVGATIVTRHTPSVDLEEILAAQDIPSAPLIQPVYDIRHFEQQAQSVAEEASRRAKVEVLRNLGQSAWPETVVIPQTLFALRSACQTSLPTDRITVAGRVISIREHGKALFATLQDQTGTLQIYLRLDTLAQKFEEFKTLVDSGDYLRCVGTVFVTGRGELTLDVQDFQIMAKCLHPLPDTFHGLQDVETRYRQRYLDLLINPEVRHRFMTRSRIVATIRRFLEAYSFLEVETPMLHPIPGGAAARPFVTHHNALGMDFYLRIAPELYLKRLVVGGLERVYEINRNFRNEGVSTRHNPEFTMLEMYMAHQDYHHMMNFLEELLRTVVALEHPSLKLEYGTYSIDFGVPFRRISPYDALKEYADLNDHDLSVGYVDTTARRLGVELPATASYQRKIFILFEACAEKHLIQPTFLIDFPLEISPLAKRDPNNPEKAARFELFIAGMEIANGFNELNDPYDQAARFKEQAVAHAAGDDEAMHYDADYITALEYGLPPCVGAGVGIDRLVMLVTNTTTIKDVILFPSLKRKQ